LTRVFLTEPSTLVLDRNIILADTSEPIEVAFDLWQADKYAITMPNIADPGLGAKSEVRNPIYRYPATISFITSLDRLNLELVDHTGRLWPATNSGANIHTFVIGPRWPSGEYRLQITLQEGGEVIGQADGGPLLMVENWWKRQFDLPQIDRPMEANFANQLKFLGYELPQSQVKAGEAFPLTLYWQALPHKSPQANFIQFNHLLDSSGTLRGGYDRRPLEYYSTLLWAPGEVVVDGYAVPVDANAPPGEYYLSVGYYITVGESAVDLPLVIDGERTDVSSVTLGPIEVLAP
jgi:hypothetical protein